MRILVCPDAFKGTLSAAAAARAIARGLADVLTGVTIDLAPMADGGTGTHEVLAASGRFQRRGARVRDALGRTVLTPFLVSSDIAVIAASSALGLERVPIASRNPLLTTSYGVGQLLRSAQSRGAGRLLVTVGGTATVDGGIGMAQALGYRFLDARGRDISLGRRRGYGGASLAEIHAIDATGAPPRLPRGRLTVAVDVRNPLCGPRGAAAVYGPQKGATPAMVEVLDHGLLRLATIAARDVGSPGYRLRGAGAGGGLAGGLLAFLGGQMIDGATAVMTALALPARIAEADVVITGEGRLDAQTLFGKTVKRVTMAARLAHRPVIVIAGTIAGRDVARRLGATLAIDASDGATLAAHDLARGAATRLRRAARDAAHAVAMIRKGHRELNRTR